MAIRLDKAVVRGVIDNTQRGRVQGQLWLIGRAEPLVLQLDGNAWRDVAGARVEFVNRNPGAQKCARGLKQAQIGITGDITVSQKVKFVTVGDEEWNRLMDEEKPVPFEWRNSLYLEWFSEDNGRVVIESAEFEVEIAEFTWQMDEAEEQAQQLVNQHAMRDWLETIIQRPEPSDEDDARAFSEAAWEESLKQSDRLNMAHMEAIEKYGEEDEDESRVAFVMGWDHLLDSLANQADPNGLGMEDEHDLEIDDAGDEWKRSESEGVEGGRMIRDSLEDPEDQDGISALGDLNRHPLVQQSLDLVLRILKDLPDERRELFHTDCEDTDDLPLDRFITNTMSIGGKLAGALGASDYAEGIEAGHTLAILKRCLNWSNEALSGLNDLLEDPAWEDRHSLFSEYKRELHSVRDGITDLRMEIRLSNPGV